MLTNEQIKLKEKWDATLRQAEQIARDLQYPTTPGERMGLEDKLNARLQEAERLAHDLRSQTPRERNVQREFMTRDLFNTLPAQQKARRLREGVIVVD
jgi:hypothetical protein